MKLPFVALASQLLWSNTLKRNNFVIVLPQLINYAMTTLLFSDRFGIILNFYMIVTNTV